jgi:glycosyltransferase involved in cell wall biosynthesis
VAGDDRAVRAGGPRAVTLSAGPTEEAGVDGADERVMRVDFISHSGADSGAEQSIVSLIAHWPLVLPRPALLLGQEGAIQERARSSGVETVVVPLRHEIATRRRRDLGPLSVVTSVFGLARHSGRVRRVMEERSTDVLVAISMKSLVSGWLATRRSGRTIVWDLHDRVDRRYLPWFLVPLLRYVVPRMVDGVVVNSRSTRNTISVGRTPVIVATPPIELDPRPFLPPGDTIRKVVMVGRLAPWKGQDLFIRAFARAFAGTATEAYIVGGALFGEDAYEQELRDEAVRLGVADRVHFVGHVKDPWAWLVDADVLAHCSRIAEPFGRVVVQGLWARCAVVATRPGGPAEVITDGVDGLLVPCGDEDATAAAFARLRDDRELRDRLVAHGPETARRYEVSVVTPEVAHWLAVLPIRGRGRRRAPMSHAEMSTLGELS